MKILEIAFSLAPGGAERFVVDLSNELSKSNDVTLMTLKDDAVDSIHRQFYKDDVCEKVNYINLKLKDGFSVKGQFQILKTIKEIKPDVVHIHAIGVLKFSFLAVFALCRKIKFYMTIHNDLHNGYDNGGFKFVARLLGGKGLVRYACLSETNYKDFVDYYPECTFRCIVNGRSPIIRTSKFESVKKEMDSYRISQNTILFLHVARYHKDKNQQLLIDVFNELSQKNVDVQLLMIGAGFDTPNGKAILAKAGRSIHHLGLRKNIGDYMLNSDLFCLSSVFEGMPITLIEASLAGTPCVSTPVCGAVDLIVDGKNGYLSKDYSLENYTEAIRKSIDNYEKIKKGAMAMRENNPYTIKSCAVKYLDYFKN